MEEKRGVSLISVCACARRWNGCVGGCAQGCALECVCTWVCAVGVYYIVKYCIKEMAALKGSRNIKKAKSFNMKGEKKEEILEE